MARSERSQWARLDFDGAPLLADLAAGMSLARVIDFEPGGLRCFGAQPASSSPLQVGEFSGSVARGASCNCSVLTLTPHANGTHTESAAHLTAERLDVYGIVPNRMLLAVLVTVDPELAADARENTLPVPHDEDQLITRAAIEHAWPAPPAARLTARAVVIRTLPNTPDKFAGGGLAAPPPFLSSEAAAWLVERGIEHLVLDVPSADRVQDGGKLTAHRLFFGLPPGSTRLAEARRRECTLTELAYIDDALRDGWYLLSLQAAAIAGDAVPSRPVLYPLRAA